MNLLQRAFALLSGFSSLKPRDQRKALFQVDRLLKQAQRRRDGALLVLREVDQLRKQRAYMLISCGRLDHGLREAEAIVAGYDEEISKLHDEAAFQQSEAALACFRARQRSKGYTLAISALEHAGKAKRVSKTLLAALAGAQEQQEETSKRKLRRHTKPKALLRR